MDFFYDILHSQLIFSLFFNFAALAEIVHDHHHFTHLIISFLTVLLLISLPNPTSRYNCKNSRCFNCNCYCSLILWSKIVSLQKQSVLTSIYTLENFYSIIIQQMDAGISINFLRNIAYGGSKSINCYLGDVIICQNELKISEILEAAINLSNRQPSQRQLKQKLIMFITKKRKNMYWLYLQHKKEKFEYDLLANDEYLMEIRRQEQLKSKSKSVFQKIKQIFVSQPVKINFGSYTLNPEKTNEIRNFVHSPRISYSTAIKIIAWMNYSVDDEIHDLMKENQRMAIFLSNQKQENELDNIVDDEEFLFHLD